jgi:hypothetical protein
MKCRINVFLFCCFFLVSFAGWSQESVKNHYSGGMLALQPGYTMTTTAHQHVENVGMGIGGILRFYFFDYLTTGIYGGSQKTTYNSVGSRNSYINLGYGGPFIGVSKKAGHFRYTASAFAGMGSIKNLHIENQTDNTLNESYLYHYSTMVFSPILSLDYAMTRKISLTMQAVYLIAAYDGGKMLYNPVLQVGILFNR